MFGLDQYCHRKKKRDLTENSHFCKITQDQNPLAVPRRLEKRSTIGDKIMTPSGLFKLPDPRKLLSISHLTRRSFLKWGVIVGLVGFPIFLSIRRRSHSPKLHTKEVSCSLQYKRYTGESLLELFQGIRIGPYSIHGLYVREGNPDCLHFTISFPDNAAIESQVKFSVQLYSDNDTVIGQMPTMLVHPHHIAPEWRNVTGTRYDQFALPKYVTAQVPLLYGNTIANIASIFLVFDENEERE